MTRSDTFEFNGQTWYFVSATKPDYKLTPSQERLPLIVLGSGIITSFVYLATYVFFKSRRLVT